MTPSSRFTLQTSALALAAWMSLLPTERQAIILSATTLRSSSTAVTSSGNPSTYGSPVTFTAAVAPTSAGGTVRFRKGGTNLACTGGNPAALSAGRATCTVNLLAAGTYLVTASYSGSYAASSGALTQIVAKADQAITFPPLADKTFGDSPFTVAATASSGLTVKLASQTTGVCTVAGSTVTLKGAGTCTLRASQAGNANYSAAPSVFRSFTVRVQVALGALSHMYDGTQKSATCTTAPGGLMTEVAYSDLGAGTARVNAGSYGVTCTVTAPGRSGAATGTLVIAKADQTITFAPLTNRTMGDAPFTAMATASSGLTVGIASVTIDVCSVSGGTVTLARTGTCTLEASQAGDSNYNSPQHVDQSFTIAASAGLHYLVAYDSVLQGHWLRGAWEASPSALYTDFSAPAPGRLGTAIEVRFGPDNGWNGFGLDHRTTDWNLYYLYLNEFRTIEFDVYFEPDSTGVENLVVIVEDAGHHNNLRLVDLIPGWNALTDAQRYGHWFHVNVDLTAIGFDSARFFRFILFNAMGGDLSQPHFRMADVKLGWVSDTTPPVVTFGSAATNLTYDQLTLTFRTNEYTIYRVEYGVTDFHFTVGGDSNAWSTSHAAVVPNLVPGTTYQYRIVAVDHRTDPDAAPNEGVFASTFAMPAIPSSPPVISGLSASGVNSHSARVAWNTNRPCAAMVTYQKTGGSPLTRSLSDYALTRNFVLDLLEASSEYAVTVLVTDAFGNSSSASITLDTTDTSTADVTISIDASTTKPISPYIYGTNQDLGASPYTFGRLGGNRWTSYNWVNNASNAGVDWYNWSDAYLPWIYGVPESQYDIPGITVLAGLGHVFATNASAALITVPVQGYVAADRGTVPNADVITTGPDYLQRRFKTIQLFKGASFTTDPAALAGEPHVYTDEYVNWVKTVAKAAHPGKSVFYSLDNEPDIWFSTHPRIAPRQESYDSLATKNEEAAKAIKSVDSDATVFGFVSYGWFGYTYLQGAPDGSWSDHNTYGDFTEYYLTRMNAAETRAGKRLVDVLDLHYYTSAQTPDGSKAVQSADVSPDVIAARVQSTRSLWDPAYVENSWITYYALPGDQAIRLIPRMQSKIDAKYPGTKLAITEYNFRGGQHISGAIAQADALGIFGQHGLFAANRWRMDADERFSEGALKIYRGFDGADANFGDISVAASSSDVSKVAVYVSQDSTRPGRVVVVAINRSNDFQDVKLSGLTLSGTARIYRMNADAAQPVFAGQVPVNGTSWFVTLPPMSISTVEIQ